MKKIHSFLAIVAIASLLWSCGGAGAIKGTQISGELSGAANLQVFLDKTGIGEQANMILDKVDATGKGTFAFQLEEGLEAGLYRLRIGSQRMNLILDGTEKKVHITGDVENLNKYDVNISGSKATSSFTNLVKGMSTGQLKIEDVETYVDSVRNPMAAMMAAIMGVGTRGQYINIHKTAEQKLSKAYPKSEVANNYQLYVAQLEQAYKQQMAAQKIQVGQPAPDIRLASPNGKEYALSELKGKVVLLDFWASWCGPCRRANPHVVETYKKYNKQGFEVFSVSLDGLDSRAKARIKDASQIDRQMESQKQRWLAAIQQDNLLWDYHVSDLKKWESGPASEYGVRSIPKTFLIDREGNIALVGINPLQGDLEGEIKKLL